MTGAGGVGGLLAMNSTSSGTHFYAMDGNGNVVGMVAGADGSRTATHEFDPFGQTLRKTGSAAGENPFRFSTKRADDAVDLVLYEYRGYSASHGRWLSRDPIGDTGGKNLTALVDNDPINFTDPHGQIKYDVQVLDDGLQTTDKEGTYSGGSTADFTAFSMPPTTSCGFLWFGTKYDTLDIQVEIAVYYRNPAAKKRTMYSGKTIEQHENGHVDIYKQKWAGTENTVNTYGKRCFCRAFCRLLRDDLINKGVEVWAAWSDTKQAELDYNDYEPSLKAGPIGEYQAALANWRVLDAEFQKLKGQFDTKCN